MYEGLFRYAIPIMIAMAFVSFLWAWLLTAVKPPESLKETEAAGKTNLHWKHLDAVPEGIIQQITQKIQPRTKAL
jgi:hypothetical protein